MKPPPFEYVRPAHGARRRSSVLGEHGDDAKVLAGGQSLVPLLNMRFARPRVLVDVNAVPGLDSVRSRERRRPGRALSFARRPSPPTRSIRERVPLAAECMPYVGHFVTRNRGTVGGSIAHADARAELPLALTVLGGKVTICTPSGGFRDVLAERFFVTHFTSVLEPTELVVETLWPAARPGSGFAFEEFALRRGDYALGMAACALRIEDGRAADVRIAVGSVGDRPLLLTDLVGSGLRARRRRRARPRDRSRRGGRRRSGRQPPRLRRLPAAPDRPPRRAGAAAGVGERDGEGEP